MFTPNRALTEKVDSNGIPYTSNRKDRRQISKLRNKKFTHKSIGLWSRKYKLPMSEWKKGLSKFLGVRLTLKQN